MPPAGGNYAGGAGSLGARRAAEPILSLPVKERPSLSLSHRLVRAVAPLTLVLALGAACASSSEDETAPVGGGSAAGAFPMADASVQLDPATKAKCEAVWSFGVFAYSAHTTTNRAPEERNRLRAGIEEYEPKAKAQAPEQADNVTKVGASARKALDATTMTPLAPEVSDANQRIVEFLQTTCKYKTA